ncbi:cyanobactin maturation protease PatG family protein [Actinoplanes sp. RD1]|uniref:cyanobactin maturation protease PatG family protein n=1 Tax=Actinoplanes sp. RD1 TaxID=3064538 RepID=UPI00274086EC|nr:hypothetical protein [Actinoplanes sp. RD1]
MEETTTPATGAGPGTTPFVWAIGRIEPRLPSLAVEKELAQVTGRADLAGHTDREALHEVLSSRANRYLARQLCWVLLIEGLETYLLAPRDPVDLDLLVESLRPRPAPTDLDVVIGIRGPLAPPETCNGLVVPVVIVDQVYSFGRDDLLAAVPRPDDVAESGDESFRATAAEVFDLMLQTADNAGATDEHRALNYLAVRYPEVYARTAAAHAGNAALAGVEVRHSPLSGVRTIVDVVLGYRHRRTDVVERYFCRVDVTEEFPFLVSKLVPYVER